MRWLSLFICSSFFLSTMLANAADETSAASATQGAETSAATSTVSAADSTATTTEDPDYRDMVNDWKSHPDARQLDNLWVLFHKTNQSYQQGLAILTPEWDNMASLLPIAKQLNQLGYDTVISFPIPEQLSVNPGDEKQQKQIADVQQKWSQSLSIITGNLTPQGHRLLIAQGSSAVWLIQQLTTDNSNMPDALVLLDAMYPDKQANQLMSDQLGAFTIPVLDLYATDGNGWLQQAAANRALAVKQMNKLNWRQRTIRDNTGIQQNLTGWFSSLGWR